MRYRVAGRVDNGILVKRSIGEARIDLKNMDAKPSPLDAERSVNPVTANLLAEYSVRPGKPRRPTIDPMLTRVGQLPWAKRQADSHGKPRPGQRR